MDTDAWARLSDSTMSMCTTLNVDFIVQLLADTRSDMRDWARIKAVELVECNEFAQIIDSTIERADFDFLHQILKKGLPLSQHQIEAVA